MADKIKPALAATLTKSDPSTGNTDRLTPARVLDLAVEAMGGIDLDPCAESLAPGASYNVPAMNHYTKEIDGLVQPWLGRVFCNPPYGRSVVDRWVDKAIQEWTVGRAEQIILLLASRTDTNWYQKLQPFTRCHVKGRLHFSGMKSGAPFPSAVFFLGAATGSNTRFRRTFNKLGGIYVCATSWSP